MMRKAFLNRSGLLLLTLLFISVSCKKTDETTYLDVPVSDIQAELNSLLEHFYPAIMDTIHGGYLTNFENDWTLSENQDKMLVTQARGLWAAARAAELYPDKALFRKAADHGFRFLTQEMWDTVHGGFYQYFYPDSLVKTEESFKLTYGNAFALYSLAQYARINDSEEAKAWVQKEFDWLEKTMHDSVYKGYYNIVYSEAAGPLEGTRRTAGWGNRDTKDQNTSIHLLEALTTTYQVLPEPKVKERLIEMLTLVRDSMTTADGYLRLFFTREWKPILNSDSGRAYIMQHMQTDHISFGHNIETAFLLTDASAALYPEPDSNTLQVAKKMIDHTLANGFDKNYYGLFDKGYLFDGSIEIIDSIKVWWAQAEAWHALALFAELYPDEPVYPAAFKQMWTYITTEVVDHQYGGWFNSGIDSNPGTTGERKAHEWKGCYHDGRALMQVLQYAKKRDE